MSKNRDGVVTHKKCREYIADYKAPHGMTDPPCRNCGQNKKKH